MSVRKSRPKRPGQWWSIPHLATVVPGGRPAVEPLERRQLLTAGNVDPSFGAGAIPIDYNGMQSFGAGVDVQADGKIVVGGTAFAGTNIDWWAMARFLPNGQLDPSFGSGGKVLKDFDGGYDDLYHLQVLSDGKILAGGLASIGGKPQDFALARFLSNGTLDSSFGTNGYVTTDFAGGVDEMYDFAVDSAGRIVTAGMATVGGALKAAAARFTADGQLDTTFATNGRYAGPSGAIQDLAIQADGRLVLAGQTQNDWLITRLNADGTLDTSFASAGVRKIDWSGSADGAWGVAVQPNGGIVVTGEVRKNNQLALGLARLGSSGSLDSGFGQGGKVLLDYNTSRDDSGRDVTLQPDGKILVNGRGFNASSDYLLARFLPNGSLDKTFHSTGYATYDFARDFDTVEALAIQPDGKMVVAAESKRNGRLTMVAARFQGDGGAPDVPDVPADPNAVYLSDLNPLGTPANGWGPYERDQSNGEKLANDGQRLTLNGMTYAKGLGTHANSQIVFALNGAYSSFQADVGLDDEVASNGSVVFQVFADGAKIYDSAKMTGNTATKGINVNVTGTQQLKLVVTDSGDNYFFDHGDWANARLIRAVNPPPASNSPVYLSDLSPISSTSGYGPVERDMSNGEQAAGDGRALTLNGLTYAKGLGAHANSEIVYSLGGQYQTFSAAVGVDDEIGNRGTVTFQVWIDGVQAFDSGVMTGSSATQLVDLSVAGASQLRLVVTDAGDNFYYDHADWADARVVI